jgi:hypothetical protein
MFTHKKGDIVNVKLHSWMVDVEVEEGTSLESITEKLAGATTFMEGVGHAEVEYMGELADEPPEVMN